MAKRAKKEATPSFVHTLPLKVSRGQERVLLSRMDMGRQLYNACLGESLKRLKVMRESSEYKEACQLPYNDKSARARAFRAVNLKHGFAEYSLHSFAVKCKNTCHIGDHLDVHTVQKIATRAFGAVQMYAFKKRGKPRFKGKGQVISLESKSNCAGIRYKTDNCRTRIEWSGLVLPCILDKKDKHGVQAHALSLRTKYARLVCRKLNGKNRFYAQIVQEGVPKQKKKNKAAQGTVSLDIGPSTVALYTPKYAELSLFCAGLDSVHKKVRILQRALDRSRRDTNPDNYNSNGTVKSGSLTWVRSKRYGKTKAKLSELTRRQAAYRESLHGELVNKILALGNSIKMEALSYKSFQRNYGKSVGFRAPGMFVSLLRRKAESAGGKVMELPAWELKLSQTCQCGHREKKSLSERWHKCPKCGIVAQRDLYSAYLAYHVENDVLDTAMALSSWPSAEPLLDQVVSRLRQQSANEGIAFPQSFGIRILSLSQSGSPEKESYTKTNIRFVASGTCSRNVPEKGLEQTFRTPGL